VPAVVLFDLGNVLVEVAGFKHLAAWLNEPDQGTVVEHWLASPAVRAFERGLCSPEEFGAAIVAEFDLPASPEDFLTDFAHWGQGLSPGAAALVDDVHRRARVACFSNSNEIHWYTQKDHREIKTLFEVAFSSHEIGKVKPDREAFEHVVAALDVAPPEIVFVDDSATNVAAARDLGIQAYRTLGVAEARAVLADLGLADRA